MRGLGCCARAADDDDDWFAVSTSRLTAELTGKSEKLIAVVVGTVTFDPRSPEVPKMSVCALRFTRQARKSGLLACARAAQKVVLLQARPS